MSRVEAARKDGKVVWYTSLALPSAERVAKLFEAKYSGIKVEVHRTGSQRILQRVMMEDEAAVGELFAKLMGDKVEPRRAFIEDNARSVANLDV